MSGVREWDRSPFGDRTSPAATVPPEGPTERLTVGAATIAIAPLADREHLDDLLRSVVRVPGLATVRVDAFEDGEALLAVTTRHPVLLASQVRARLEGRVRSVTPAGPGGRVVVDARAPIVPVPEPEPEPQDEVPADASAADAPADGEAVADDHGSRGDGDAPDDDAAGGDGARDGAGTDADAATPDPAAAAVAAALAGAIDDTPGLAVFVFDADLRITATAGVSAERPDEDAPVLVGRHVVQAFPVVARRLIAGALAGALAGEERTVALPGDDGQVELEATCRPVGPGLPGGVCVVRDLASRGAGTLLVEATRAFEITFRHSPIGQGLLSRTGRWLRVNGALAELLGRPAEQLVGGEAVESLHPDDRADERDRLDRLVAGRDDHYVVGARFVHADGHVVRTHTRMSRIADDDGAVRGFVAQVVDAAAWRRFRG